MPIPPLIDGRGDVHPGSAAPSDTKNSLNRETLGRLVRVTWIEWAYEQAAPKPSWLVPWDDMAECDREVDRRIGERVAQATIAQAMRTARDLLRRARIRLVDELSAKELDAEIVAFLGKCPGATTNESQRCAREQGHPGRCFDGKYTFVNGDPPVTREASYAEARDAQKPKE